jgi:hypothetical protein
MVAPAAFPSLLLFLLLLLAVLLVVPGVLC